MNYILRAAIATAATFLNYLMNQKPYPTFDYLHKTGNCNQPKRPRLKHKIKEHFLKKCSFIFENNLRRRSQP